MSSPEVGDEEEALSVVQLPSLATATIDAYVGTLGDGVEEAGENLTLGDFLVHSSYLDCDAIRGRAY